jgi:hypothetical protein
MLPLSATAMSCSTVPVLAPAVRCTCLAPNVAQRVQEGYGFQRVRPTITLFPDRDCVFVAAELSVELYATSASGQPVGRPIAYDVQPVEVVEELPYRERSGTNVEVSGEAGAAFGKLLAKLTAENSLERNGVRVIQRLYGYGVNFPKSGGECRPPRITSSPETSATWSSWHRFHARGPSRQGSSSPPTLPSAPAPTGGSPPASARANADLCLSRPISCVQAVRSDALNVGRAESAIWFSGSRRGRSVPLSAFAASASP